MPGVSLHQNCTTGGNEFGDQFWILIELMDKEIVHDGQFPRIPVTSHLDLTATAFRLLWCHSQKLYPVLMVWAFGRLESCLYRGKNHAIESHAAGLEIT